MSHIFIAFIKTYQRIISPLFGAHCRFHPSCSQYAVESFQQHGSIKGLVLSIVRISKCGPWTEGGFDPVPNIENNLDE